MWCCYCPCVLYLVSGDTPQVVVRPTAYWRGGGGTTKLSMSLSWFSISIKTMRRVRRFRMIIYTSKIIRSNNQWTPCSQTLLNRHTGRPPSPSTTCHHWSAGMSYSSSYYLLLHYDFILLRSLEDYFILLSQLKWVTLHLRHSLSQLKWVTLF